jgi:hypothetical protein
MVKVLSDRLRTEDRGQPGGVLIVGQVSRPIILDFESAAVAPVFYPLTCVPDHYALCLDGRTCTVLAPDPADTFVHDKDAGSRCLESVDTRPPRAVVVLAPPTLHREDVHKTYYRMLASRSSARR